MPCHPCNSLNAEIWFLLLHANAADLTVNCACPGRYVPADGAGCNHWASIQSSGRVTAAALAKERTCVVGLIAAAVSGRVTPAAREVAVRSCHFFCTRPRDQDRDQRTANAAPVAACCTWQAAVAAATAGVAVAVATAAAATAAAATAAAAVAAAATAAAAICLLHDHPRIYRSTAATGSCGSFVNVGHSRSSNIGGGEETRVVAPGPASSCSQMSRSTSSQKTKCRRLRTGPRTGYRTPG
eukprot:scaffold25398_cov63-Phaeocystis_antarctica.AAC.3